MRTSGYSFFESKRRLVAMMIGFALVMGTYVFPPTVSAITIYTGILEGSNEVPPNGSTAIGAIIVTLNGDLLTVQESFAGLIGGPAAAAHIHCCAPVGVNAIVAVPFSGFPSATSGIYTNTFDLTLASSYNPAFVTASGGTVASAEATLIANLNSGLTYANIHNATFGGGEIRGQLAALPGAAVPEPTSVSLLTIGLMALAARRRKTHVG